MRIVLKSIREDIDRAIDEARAQSRTVERIELSEEEMDELKAETVAGRAGQEFNTYRGFFIKIVSE